MMSRFSFAARVAVLLGTGWLLIATSPPPRKCPALAPVTFEVTGTCGPSGQMTVENDEECQVRAAGADTVHFPPSGNLGDDDSTILTGEWIVSEYGLTYRVPGGAQNDAGIDGGIDDTDGGTDSDAGSAVDGGANYKPGADYQTCRVTPTGTAGLLTFECYDLVTAEPACTGQLEQKL